MPIHVRGAGGRVAVHRQKGSFTVFDIPLGILQTQELYWCHTQRAGRTCRYPEPGLTLLHCRHPTFSAGWVRQHVRFFAHSLTQSPNIQCSHGLHISRNQECPCFIVPNSITKPMSLSWFCKQNNPLQELPNWYKYSRGTEIQLCYTV